VMVGGPPCQGFSTVGRRDSRDPRNKLWTHYLELVAQIRPAYVVVENVEGLVVMDRGNVCEQIVASFGRIGYRANGNCYGQPTTASRSFENALSSLRRSTYSPSPTFGRPRFQGREVRRPRNQAPISRRTTEAKSTRAKASLCIDASINSRPRKGPRRVAAGASPPSNLHRPPVGRANQSPLIDALPTPNQSECLCRPVFYLIIACIRTGRPHFACPEFTFTEPR
jgi:site-specific DNA-cytosine methylase